MTRSLLFRAARLSLPALLGLWLAACSNLSADPAPAPSAQASVVSTTGPQQFTLGNGLELIVQPDRRAPTAVHMLWLRVGAIDEVDGISGVAHVLEHMMFKGSDMLPAGEFSRRVAQLGGQENAFTSRDHTGYYQQVPASRLGDVMALEAERFAHSRYSDADFVKELEVVKEERRMRTEDNPRALLFEQQMATAFTASPYRRPVIGWMGDLNALTPDDARDFYQRWYVPANAAVVVVGDVDAQQVLALAQKHYGRIPARALPVRKPRPEPPQAGQRRIELKAPAEQALLSLAFKVPQLQGLEASPDNDDALALTVLAAVLDGYDGARLERALTRGPERIADSVGASNGLFGRGPQLFMLTGIPAAGKSPAELETALLAQVQRVAREGIDEAELQRVKTQWIASQVYKRDSVMGQAQELGSLWVQGLPMDADARLVARLKTINAGQVQAVAARYFNPDQMTAATLLPQPRAAAAQP